MSSTNAPCSRLWTPARCALVWTCSPTNRRPARVPGTRRSAGTAGLNVEHMENRVFRGGHAAVASIDVAGQASDALLADLREIPHVLGVSEVTLGKDAEPGP
jgi:hypothetical protein